jgi:Zn-dependent protease
MGMLLNTTLALVLAVAALVTLMLALAVRRLLRLRWKAMQGRAVPREAVPAADRQVLDSAALELEALDFVYRCSGTSDILLVAPDKQVFYDLYQHADGHTHAVVAPSTTPEPGQRCVVQLVTCLQDGSNWVTLNRYRHNSPFALPDWQVFDDYLPRWQQAWQRHLERVQAATTPICTDGVEVCQRFFHSFEQLMPALVRQGHMRPIDHSSHYRLGWRAAWRIAVQASWGQWRAAWALRHAVPETRDPEAAGEGQLDAELRAYHELRAAQRANPLSTRGKWWLFWVSAALFLLVGGLWLSWSFVPIVLAVVALHEGGHYLAMRLTGYANLSVFFLPGLGGLASGDKPSATPFEKLLVYLAGPVPGILLAGAVYWASVAGQWAGPPWLTEVLLASLLINYFNLLPFMPLDGGRVLETLVFARYPRLRFGFAAVCCGLLFALGSMLDDLVLRVLALVLALALPHQWRLMRLDQAVLRDRTEALDEPQALRAIFAALQLERFRGWSFARRSAAATALLPELQGRRARPGETVAGLLIYGVCLLGPPAGLLWVYPQLSAVIPFVTSAYSVTPDEVDAEPAPPPNAAPKDWKARLVESASLSPQELLQANLGAGQEASATEDYEAAQRHYLAAWAIAKTLHVRDLRRIEALQGLATAVDQNSERLGYLMQIVAELESPQGPERLHVAQAKEQLSYAENDPALRVALLQDAVRQRALVGPAQDPTLQLTRHSLAKALDAHGNVSAAESVLQQRIDSLPVPAPRVRTREALGLRVQRVNHRLDLAWFLLAHGRAADTQNLLALAQAELPAQVTVSWLMPVQQTHELRVWAQLLSGQTTGLAASWAAYDAALASGPGAPGRKLLFHEADRALVAQALNDAQLLASAKSGVLESRAKMSKVSPMLCQPPTGMTQPNWRQPQQDARRRVLTELGACPPA